MLGHCNTCMSECPALVEFVFHYKISFRRRPNIRSSGIPRRVSYSFAIVLKENCAVIRQLCCCFWNPDSLAFRPHYYRKNGQRLLVLSNLLVNHLMLPHEEVLARQRQRLCQDVIQQVMGFENARYFFRPVNPATDDAPGYYRSITSPMSVFEVQEKLDRCEYSSFDEFVCDMRRIWQNAQIYNSASHPVHKAAERISRRFETIIAAIPREVGGSSALQRVTELRFRLYKAHRKQFT